MCVTFLWVNDECNYDDSNDVQLILINNRDEYYHRPTQNVSWNGNVLCSRDLEPGREGGTWLGVNRFGKLAFIHNINYPVPENAGDLKGRGHLIIDYLSDRKTGPVDYAKQLSASGQLYNGFSLMLIAKSEESPKINNNANEAGWKVVHCSNRDGKIDLIKSGFHGFGNCPIDRQFKKVQKGHRLFEEYCLKWRKHRDMDLLISDLLLVLTDSEQCFPDNLMVQYQPALAEHLVRYMTSCFVEFPSEFNYGTRANTIILIDGKNNVTYVERSLEDPVLKKWSTKRVEFTLNKLA